MSRTPFPISRRRWLLGSMAFAALGAAPKADESPIESVRSKGRKAGMEGFDESESPNFRAIGDAPARFREEALEVCEAVATDYRKHFADKGFALDSPKEKLTVVTLRGPKSYAAFEGGFIDEAIGGHFDLEANRLVTFDFRGPGANPKVPVPEQTNTLALVHETIHQLTFNTGVLDLKADVPLCISEGLATYAETWRPRHKGEIGAINIGRRRGLDLGRRQGLKWIPLAALLADDKPFTDDKTQLAYAESWMFVQKMMKEPARTTQFRDYLAGLRGKHDPKERVAVATAHLGDLEKLDRSLRPTR